MCPIIQIGSFVVSTFTVCAAVGVALLIVTVIIKLRHSLNFAQECYYVIPKLCIALGFAYGGAIFFDALFKIPQNGGLRLSGMTFYGGLIVGCAVFYALIRIFRNNTEYSPMKLLNIVTVPFLLFHFCGRIGCFAAGCCYGKVTDCLLGLVFPDRPEVGIYHYGVKVFPTQLYESIGLGIFAVILFVVKQNEFISYLFVYPIMRFCLEFLRGDNRGMMFFGLSPAQLISVIIVLTALSVIAIRTFVRKSDWYKSRQV